LDEVRTQMDALLADPAGWERLLERTVRADSITSVLADLGRPVVGLVEPERELARARADLTSIKKGSSDPVVS